MFVPRWHRDEALYVTFTIFRKIWRTKLWTWDSYVGCDSCQNILRIHSYLNNYSWHSGARCRRKWFPRRRENVGVLQCSNFPGILFTPRLCVEIFIQLGDFICSYVFGASNIPRSKRFYVNNTPKLFLTFCNTYRKYLCSTTSSITNKCFWLGPR